MTPSFTVELHALAEALTEWRRLTVRRYGYPCDIDELASWWSTRFYLARGAIAAVTHLG